MGYFDAERLAGLVAKGGVDPARLDPYDPYSLRVEAERVVGEGRIDVAGLVELIGEHGDDDASKSE